MKVRPLVLNIDGQVFLAFCYGAGVRWALPQLSTGHCLSLLSRQRESTERCPGHELQMNLNVILRGMNVVEYVVWIFSIYVCAMECNRCYCCQ